MSRVAQCKERAHVARSFFIRVIGTCLWPGPSVSTGFEGSSCFEMQLTLRFRERVAYPQRSGGSQILSPRFFHFKYTGRSNPLFAFLSAHALCSWIPALCPNDDCPFNKSFSIGYWDCPDILRTNRRWFWVICARVVSSFKNVATVFKKMGHKKWKNRSL